jgi:uncharacterized protein (TIGR03437 family)
LQLDGAGAIYFADSGNDRVRRLVLYTPPADVVAAVTVVNAFSGVGGNVAPGELVTISGAGFGSVTDEVRFGLAAAAVLEAQAGRLVVVAPEELGGTAPARVEVRVAGKLMGAADVGVSDAAPGVLPLMINEDGSLNTELRRASAGKTLTLLVTGQGRLVSARPVLPVTVTIAGVPCEVMRAEAAGAAGGMMLVVVRVAGGFVPSGEVPLVLKVGSASAPAVGVWLQ